MSKILVFLFCAVYVLADVNIPPPPVTFPIIPTSSPTPPTSSIAPPTTPPTKPTTPPTKPTTPTTPPTKPTTPPTKPTTPLTKPTTPPTKPTPPPTPSPTPVGPPVINNFTGNYSDSKRICLMMKMEVQVELLDKNSTKINVTEKVTFNTTCQANSTTETLGLFWGSNSLMFTFFKNNSKFEIQSISASLLVPGANTTQTYYHKKPEFSVSAKQSYKCVRDQPLNLTDIDSKTTYAKLHISHLQYQAFMNTTEAHYDSAWYCDSTNTPDIVPVVVGCVLAVLVVLILVAYLFGRRRCQARGYLSM